ncbi:MAG: peptidase U32 family protein, partial [Anaerovorax sp.]
MLKIPELLAPAGGFEQLRAAVENGADAVYMGGKLFNARMNAKNFEEEELYQALAYAHVRGVKLYITMNTLLFEEELEEAVSYAKELYEMGVDALILQDFGLAKLIRTYLPNMEIHLSTQGTIYNASGVSAAKEMGFQRVVLARETSLEEITEMTRENVAEIEIFVHGALCICYSGQCQMSREIGGRSGNRGSCGQPCRLPYSIYEEIKGKKVKVKDETFLLSPKDLCTIENLGAFAEAGVSSLKIEGRMKSPEYVATVTRIYRNYLDIYREKGSYTVSPQDFKDLNQIFNRGGFTDGYLFGNHGEAMMSGALSKHQGIYLGKVLKNSTGNNYIQVDLEEPLSLGDGIEVRTPGLPGNVVTFLKIVEEGKGNAIKAGGKSIRTAFPGQTVIMGDVCGSFKKGDRVYKITDRGLLESAKASYEAK